MHLYKIITSQPFFSSLKIWILKHIFVFNIFQLQKRPGTETAPPVQCCVWRTWGHCLCIIPLQPDSDPGEATRWVCYSPCFTDEKIETQSWVTELEQEAVWWAGMCRGQTHLLKFSPVATIGLIISCSGQVARVLCGSFSQDSRVKGPTSTCSTGLP